MRVSSDAGVEAVQSHEAWTRWVQGVESVPFEQGLERFDTVRSLVFPLGRRDRNQPGNGSAAVVPVEGIEPVRLRIGE